MPEREPEPGSCRMSIADDVERFDLADGRPIEIRPMTEDDGALICELYRSLSPTDRRLRFFGSFHPSVEWCRNWAGIGARGGYGVVALVHADDGTDAVEVAGEAAYALRSDGDGELAVTVAAPWRGWLGPYLIDRLIRHAAVSDVPNLHADVRIGNGPMLAILDRRDPVAIGHDEGSVHLSIGTSTPTATWPRGEARRRVLVATSGSRWVGERAAEDAGLATVMCPGPARRRRSGCPVLEGGRCPLADGADVIVVMLDPDDDDTVALIEKHRAMLPGTPILSRPRSDEKGEPGRAAFDGEPRRELDNGCIDVALRADEAVAQLLALVGDGRAAGPADEPSDEPPDHAAR